MKTTHLYRLHINLSLSCKVLISRFVIVSLTTFHHSSSVGCVLGNGYHSVLVVSVFLGHCTQHSSCLQSVSESDIKTADVECVCFYKGNL